MLIYIFQANYCNASSITPWSYTKIFVRRWGYARGVIHGNFSNADLCTKICPLGYTRAKTEEFKKFCILHVQPTMGGGYTPGGYDYIKRYSIYVHTKIIREHRLPFCLCNELNNVSSGIRSFFNSVKGNLSTRVTELPIYVTISPCLLDVNV